MVYFLMTSLGEMATFMPDSGSFGIYASKFVDPAFGFAMGWNYWYNWAITVAAEMVAAVSGIGWMVLDASKYLRNDIVYVGVIIMGIIAIILDSFVRFLIRKASPWLEK
jgi:amino acid permease